MSGNSKRGKKSKSTEHNSSDTSTAKFDLDSIDNEQLDMTGWNADYNMPA
jgi:hypothetical protein